jgi:hypothetical protein
MIGMNGMLQREAVQMRPWRAEDGPPPRMRVYRYGERPLLSILTEGRWRRCPVRARADWPDGRVEVHVDVFLPDDGGATFPRVYRWDPAVMRPL